MDRYRKCYQCPQCDKAYKCKDYIGLCTRFVLMVRDTLCGCEFNKSIPVLHNFGVKFDGVDNNMTL